MEDGDTEKYHPSRVIQDFVFLSRKQGCIRCIYLQVYNKKNLSYDVASGSEITPCNKICKPLVVYRFTGNVVTSITTLRT